MIANDTRMVLSIGISYSTIMSSFIITGIYSFDL